MAETQEPIAVTLRHINWLRKAWGLNRGKGRPRRVACQKKAEPLGQFVRVPPSLACVGVHVFAAWWQQHERRSLVRPALQQAMHRYHIQPPADDFPLVHHRAQTLRRRFQALFVAPLLGMETLTAFDTRAHPVLTLLGQGYHSSTLGQFLGQRERINAAEALMPALGPHQPGQVTYGDGHMMAFWTRVAMHKGKSTMVGRIMADSHAISAHKAMGQALFVTYYPPARPLSQVLVAYGQQVVEATGSRLVVSDRAVNSLALACACAPQGWGVLCMLDDNEHAGLARFDATLVDTPTDGTRVYSGAWTVPRPEDPRHVGIVEPAAGKLLVYGGPAKVRELLEVRAWPHVYRERSEIPANSCKRRIDHGALHPNYGRKTMLGVDRPQQRAQEQLDHAREAAQKRVEQQKPAVTPQQAKVRASASTGHGKRLEQRQHTLGRLDKASKDAQYKHDQLAAAAGALGPLGARADRDFRPQTLMTVRTLL